MRIRSATLLLIGLVLLPILISIFQWGVATAIVLVVVLLTAKWFTILAGFGSTRGAALRLETIALSHFVEKVRWSMDRLGVPYEEEQVAGILGVFFTGRTVPRLHVRTGNVTSVIGNSSDILRYLWGRYAAEYGDRAAFLEPTAEALALEEKLDRYGVDLQRWGYFHLLPNRELTLRAWGKDDPSLPVWQRALLPILYPILTRFMGRVFSLNPHARGEASSRIERLLTEIESSLADGRTSLLGGPIRFVDITFSALSALWIFPPEYAAGKAAAVMSTPDQLPAAMIEDLTRWRTQFPRVTQHIERLYRDERL